MNKKLFIFIIILIIVAGATLAILIYFKSSKPFLDVYLKEESFQGILDMNSVLLTREGGKTEDGSCNVYIKDIPSKKETFLTKLTPCHTVGVLGLHLSKDKKHIVFKSGLSIYDYNINSGEYSLIFEVDKVFSEDFFIEYRLNLMGFSPKENKILFDKITYKNSKGDEGWKNTTQKVEIYVYDIIAKNITKVYENIFIAKFITDPSTGSWDEGRMYVPLTRWSPDGEAIIFESGIGDLPRKQYIIYLDDLNVKELTPENVRGDINTCGYWYNKGAEEPVSIEGFSPYVFRTLLFPDGKTYLQRKSIYQRGCMDCSPIRFKFYIKRAEQSYCVPLNN